MRIRILVRLLTHLSHKKFNFYIKKYTFSRKLVRKHTYEGTKAFLKGRKPGLFVNFSQFPCFWIQIRISNADPDPRQLNKCGSRWIRIRNTASNWCFENCTCIRLPDTNLVIDEPEGIFSSFYCYHWNTPFNAPRIGNGSAYIRSLFPHKIKIFRLDWGKLEDPWIESDKILCI
jgi:hypothetical protein